MEDANNTTDSPVINSTDVYANATRHIIDNADEDFHQVVLKFGVSILVVGCLLLAALVLLFLVGIGRKRVQQSMQRRTASRQFNYDNQVDIMDEDGEGDRVARNGVLVISHSTDCQDPKERLSSSSDRAQDYEATSSSMANYIERNGLPQAII